MQHQASLNYFSMKIKMTDSQQKRRRKQLDEDDEIEEKEERIKMMMKKKRRRKRERKGEDNLREELEQQQQLKKRVVTVQIQRRNQKIRKDEEEEETTTTTPDSNFPVVMRCFYSSDLQLVESLCVTAFSTHPTRVVLRKYTRILESLNRRNALQFILIQNLKYFQNLAALLSKKITPSLFDLVPRYLRTNVH